MGECGMKRIKYLICILAVALLTIIPALAAEGEEIFVSTEAKGCVALSQEGDLTGLQTSGQNCLSAVASSEEETLYQTIYQGLCNQQSTITVSMTIQVADSNQVNAELNEFQSRVIELYQAVINDNPRLFYATEGYRIQSEGRGTTAAFVMTAIITPGYRGHFSEEQIRRFNQTVDALVCEAQKVQTDLEKALFIHDYLATHVSYNRETATGQDALSQNVYTAYGALIEGDAVCQGYALAYQLLLRELGIDCITVTSGINQMNHMWNLVRMDGYWYHVDVTWDDPVPNLEGRCDHSYFMLSDETISDETHNHYGWDTTAPECTSTKYETSWIFNDTELPIYWWDNKIYYAIRTNGRYTIYATEEMNEEGSLYATSEMSFVNQNNYIVNSAVWTDGALCYVDQNKNLKMLSLQDKSESVLGTISNFTAMDSVEKDENGKPYYPAIYDGIGLRYDETTKSVHAISANRAEELGTFVILNYPPQWGQDIPCTTTLVGARWMDDSTLQIGVVYVSSEAKPTLWAATYKDGRMTGVNQVDTSKLNDGLNILELRVPSGKSVDTRLFLLSKNSCIPVGNMVTVP